MKQNPSNACGPHADATEQVIGAQCNLWLSAAMSAMCACGPKRMDRNQRMLQDEHAVQGAATPYCWRTLPLYRCCSE